MPTLELRNKALELTGGRDALLSALAKLPPGGDGPTKLRGVVREAITPGVQAMVEAHLNTLLEEQEMWGGNPRPAERGQAQIDWDSQLDDALRVSLGDNVTTANSAGVISISDAERLTVDAHIEDQQRRGQLAAELTKAIVGGSWDIVQLMEKLGITEADLANPANTLREVPGVKSNSGPVDHTQPAHDETTLADVKADLANPTTAAAPTATAAPESTSAEAAPSIDTATLADVKADLAPMIEEPTKLAGKSMLATVIGEKLQKDGDIMQVMTDLGAASQGDVDATRRLGFTAPPAAHSELIKLVDADPIGWMDTLLAEATAAQAEPVKKGRAKKNTMEGEVEKKVASERAAKTTPPNFVAGLETLLDITDYSEAKLAAELNISRAKLNQMRKGEAHYNPNDAAKFAIGSQIQSRIDKLTATLAAMAEGWSA